MKTNIYFLHPIHNIKRQMTYFIEVMHHGVETRYLADVVRYCEQQTPRQISLRKTPEISIIT